MTMTQAYAAAAVMVSTNQKKVHSPVKFAGSVKPREPMKLYRPRNVATNAAVECNLHSMENVNHVLEERIERKAFNPLAKDALLEEQHQKQVLSPSKNVHYQCAIQARI